ncbi:MAG: Cof-type HAD-IIB family hydrolase [Treponema sp.]|jgi:Cof subfamily protein (haloacid dehalogenase superfamily)|nr:Cof-type HAD-IIB family hydrolase [Treponema sp.]
MQKKINPSTIKALALDLDGTTLLPDNSLGDKTAQCLKRLIAQGMQVILCTGRAIESSRRYYSAIGAKGPMVFFNGAEVAEVPDVKLISSHLMGLDVVDYGIDLARSMDIHFQVFFSPQSNTAVGLEKNCWEALFIEKQRPEAEMYYEHTGIMPVVADLKTVIAAPGLQGVMKAMFIVDPALHDEIRQKMYDRFGSRIYIVRSFSTFLEVMNAGVSKGEGLKTVMDCRGLKPHEVIAFGDEENDLPMFSVAGFSAAPSNAKEKVREAADFIFGSNAEEGLAAFLDDLFK